MNRCDDLPIPAGADVEDFRLHSRAEIVALLREIAERRALISIHFNGGREFIVTSLLEVNPEFEELVIDQGADDESNAHLQKCGHLTVVTSLDHIKIQFVAASASVTTYEGLPAFRIRMPESLLRLQRRNAFRTHFIMGEPGSIWVAHPRNGLRMKLRLLDLSVGGIAMTSAPETFDAEVGDLLPGCRMELPEQEPFHVDLEVRNTTFLPDTTRAPVKRFGCRFVALPGTLEAMIQRVILAVERNRHALT